MIEYYLRYILFFFLLSVSNNLQGQKTIIPFEDYSKCMTGFLNAEGDTILPAQFESVSENRIYRTNWSSSNDTVYWMVNFHGHYGYISNEGEWLIKPQFDDFSIAGKYIIVTKNNKYGVFNNHGKNILPIELDTIYQHSGTLRDQKPLFCVKKDELLGLYSNEFKMIVPPLYENIDVCNYHILGSAKYFAMYLASGKIAQVYDTLGKPILPFKYTEIIPFISDFAVSHSHLYGVKNAKNQYSVLNSEGKELVPMSPYAFYPLQTTRDIIEKRPARYVQQYKADRWGEIRISRLSDGKTSPWYSSVGVAGDWFVVYTNEKWKVLDSNLNMVFEQPDSHFQLEAFSAYSEHYSVKLRTPDEYHDFSMHEHFVKTYGEDVNLPQIFVLEHSGEQLGTKLVYGKVQPVYRKRYALLHMTTKTQTVAKYDKIVRFSGGGKTFYWAVYPNEDTTDNEKKFWVDVYDTDVKLLRTIFINTKENDQLGKCAREIRVTPFVNMFNSVALWQFKDSTIQHIRWIDGSQPAVANFDYPIVDMGIHSDSSGYILLKDHTSGNYLVESILGGKHPFKGKTFTGVKFYNLGNKGFLISPTILIGDEIMFTDRVYNVLLDSCSLILQGLNPEGYLELANAGIVVVRNGFLYGFINQKFELMDSTRIKSPHAKFWISNEGYVDKAGRFFAEKSPVMAGYYVGTVSNERLTIEHRKTGEQFFFDHISSASEYYDMFRVRSVSGKIGLISGRDATWLVKPKYDSIVTIDYDRKDYFLAKKGKNSDKWSVVSAKGKEITKPVFDTTFLFSWEEEYAFARSNGKMGVLNKKFNWSTKPIYDTCGRVNNIDMLYDKTNYAFVDEYTGKSFSSSADSVFVSFWSECVVLFDKGTVEVCKFNGETILPRSDIQELLDNDKVYRITHPRYIKVKTDYLDENRSPIESIPVLNKRIKYIELENLRMRSISKDSLMLYRYQQSSSSSNQGCFTSPEFFSKFYYTEKIEGDCVVENPWMCNAYGQNEEYINYRISNDSLIRIRKLSELFIPNSNWESRVNDLIAEAIQADQVFGLSCVDIPATIEVLKPRFIVQDQTIRFEVCDYRGTQLLISTLSLKDILRWPEPLNE